MDFDMVQGMGRPILQVLFRFILYTYWSVLFICLCFSGMLGGTRTVVIGEYVVLGTEPEPCICICMASPQVQTYRRAERVLVLYMAKFQSLAAHIVP